MITLVDETTSTSIVTGATQDPVGIGVRVGAGGLEGRTASCFGCTGVFGLFFHLHQASSSDSPTGTQVHIKRIGASYGLCFVVDCSKLANSPVLFLDLRRARVSEFRQSRYHSFIFTYGPKMSSIPTKSVDCWQPLFK